MKHHKAKRRAVYAADLHPRIISEALDALREARRYLRGVGSKNAADYVARAIKSAEGALRHAEHCRARGVI